MPCVSVRALAPALCAAISLRGQWLGGIRKYTVLANPKYMYRVGPNCISIYTTYIYVPYIYVCMNKFSTYPYIYTVCEF
jgi:hypothetical protein